MAQIISQRVAQQIVETVKDLCKHDINFIDSQGIIFASTNVSRIGEFHEVGSHVLANGQTIEVEDDNSFIGTNKGVNMPFVYQGEVIAVIGISGKPDEVRQYAYLAQKITTLILREHELEAQSSSRKEQMSSIVRALAAGEHINHNYFMAYLEHYQIDFTKEYQTILIQLNSRYNLLNLSMIEHHIYRFFEQTESPLIAFQYPNEYVMMLETEKMEKWIPKFRELASYYHGILKIGIGNKYPLMKQSLSCQNARLALHSILTDENIVLFEELNLEILLGNISQDAKEQFLKKTMKNLEEKDIKLLTIYFECDMSLKQTCEKLFLHKNTLQYQLDKIWRNCGYNPREFKDAVILYLGIRMK